MDSESTDWSDKMTGRKHRGRRQNPATRRRFLQSIGITAVLGAATSGHAQTDDGGPVVYGYGGVPVESSETVDTSSDDDRSTEYQGFGEYGYGGVA